MDNPLVVREVALRADDTALELLSQVPSIWSLIKPELASQFFWYQRTCEAFNLPDYLSWTNASSENWHQIYNILVATRTGNPFNKPTMLDLNNWNLVAVKLLLEWGYSLNMTNIYEAAEYGNLEVLQLLLEDKEMDSDVLEGLMSSAASGGKLDTLQFLLTDNRSQDALDEDKYPILVSAFEEAVYASHLPAADLLWTEIGSRDIAIYESVDDQYDLVREAIEHSSSEMIQYLIDKSLIDTGDRDWIELSIKKGRSDLFLLLIGNDSPFGYLDLSNPDEIGKYLLNRTSKPVRHASELSGLSEETILEMLIQTDSDFDRHHFEMLLREIVTAQLDLEYYISWLTKTEKRPTYQYGWRVRHNNRSISRLLLGCIDSIYALSVVHTSAYFTAYSAFFLLANSSTRDVQAVLNTIQSEQGVTDEGLLKARLLLGAFDSRARPSTVTSLTYKQDA